MNQVEQQEQEVETLPEPRIEEIEEEWAALGCSCDCTWDAEQD